jgi:hypothetical protein
VAEEGQQVRRLLLVQHRLLRLRLHSQRFLPAAGHLVPLVQVEDVAAGVDVVGLLGQGLLLVRPVLERSLREHHLPVWAWEEAGELPRQRHQPRDCSDRLSW